MEIEKNNSSIDITFNLSEDEIQALVQYAINDILKKKIEKNSLKKIFYKITCGLESIKYRYITKNTIYVCKSHKYENNSIILKFSRKKWIVLKNDGTWSYVKNNNPDIVTKIRKGEFD